MKVSIKVENKELLESSVVHIENNQDIEFEIEGLKLKFIFVENDENNKSSYKGTVEGDTFVMRLNYFVSEQGEGVLTPLELGNINGRKLYITFFIYTYGKKERRFEYNLYLGALS